MPARPCHVVGVGTLQTGVLITTLVQRWLGHSCLSAATIYADASEPEEVAFAKKYRGGVLRYNQANAAGLLCHFPKRGMMMRSILGLFAATMLVTLGLNASPAQSRDAGAFQVAAGSCSGTYATCVARCRRDNPQDRACPSDHCAPKLATCKTSGCWQEGQRYGGKLTCNLQRG